VPAAPLIGSPRQPSRSFERPTRWLRWSRQATLSYPVHAGASWCSLRMCRTVPICQRWLAATPLAY